jgi:glycolate oxidase iron-sulfur subunit
MLKLALRHIFPHPQRLERLFSLLKRVRANLFIKSAMESGLIRRISSKADFALSLLMTSSPAGGRPNAASGTEKIPARTAGEDGARPVAVFTGCVMEGLFKHANDATKRVLTANGCRIDEVQSQICCGALHAHAGDIETARQLARRNIDAFDRFLRSGQPPDDHPDNQRGTRAAHLPTIIINAAGCGSVLKEYGELLKDDPQYAERARSFSRQVSDVTEFLAKGEIRRGAELKRRVTYDAPCHLYHAQRVTIAPQQLLAAIPGLEYSQLDGMQDCCGGAGIYNLSEPEMSESLLSDKIEKVKATGAEVLVTANPGCHMQLGAGVRMFKADCRVSHIVELLDESYRKAGFYGPAENGQ